MDTKVTINNKLGEFIKRKRISKGLSLRKFAEVCGISHSYLDSIEKGKDPRNGEPVRPTADTLSKLAHGLGIDASILFSLSIGEDIPTPKTVDDMSNDDIILLASKRLGYGDGLSEFELEKVKLAIQIALTKK